MNIVSWIAIIIILLSVLNGFRRGFVASIFSTFTFIIAIVAAAALSPQISSRMMNTSFYDTVNSGVESALFSAQNDDNTGSASYSGYSMEDYAGLSSDQSEQSQLIDSLPLPESAKETLKQNNNADIYGTLGVNAFQGYVSSYIARMVIRVLAFIIVFLVVFIILRLIGLALGLASRLPVLGALNRIGGLLFGLVNGIFIIWLICTAVTIFGGTQLAEYINESIDQSRLLSALYNNNILLDILTRLNS